MTMTVTDQTDTDPHTLVSEPYETTRPGPHADHEWLRLRCSRVDCKWTELHIVNEHETVEAAFDRQHGCINAGKAPNITPEYVFVAGCSVCPDEPQLDTDGDSIWCDICHSQWSMDGTHGTVDA